MLKTGSEHLFTSAQLICYTKQNYLFLHKTGSAATFSLAAAVEGRKKRKKVQLHHPLPSSSPTQQTSSHVPPCSFLGYDCMLRRQPKIGVYQKTRLQKKKKKSVVAIIVLFWSQKKGRGCVGIVGSEGDAAFRNCAVSYSAVRFFLMGLELLYGFNSACCTCKNK